jgi:hypothetical protein
VASYEPRHQRFIVRSRQYTQQYSHIYTRRLTALRPLVLEAARRRWGETREWRAGPVVQRGRCWPRLRMLRLPGRGVTRPGPGQLPRLHFCPHCSPPRLAHVPPTHPAASVRLASKLIDLRPSSSAGKGGGASDSEGDDDVRGASRGSAGGAGWGGEYIAVGCIYKEQPLKPSIIDEYSGDRTVAAPPKPRANYSGADDSLVLEDESGRVALAPAVRRGGGGGVSSQAARAFARLVGQLVSGVVLGVRGRVLATGELTVDDVVLPGLTLLPGGPKVPHPLAAHLPPQPKGEPPLFLLLVSGLAAGGAPGGGVTGLPQGSAGHAGALQLLLEWTAGLVGGGSNGGGGGADGSEPAGAARIARVIVAGGSVGTNAGGAGAGTGAKGGAASASAAGAGAGGSSSSSSAARDAFADRTVSGGEQEAAVAPLREADVALAALAAVAPVDVMAGDGEPSNASLPQQPLHPVLFPAATRYSSFRCVTVRRARTVWWWWLWAEEGLDARGGAPHAALTPVYPLPSPLPPPLHPLQNPYAAEVGGVRVTGHSGQPLDDVARFAGISDVMSTGSTNTAAATAAADAEAAVAAAAAGDDNDGDGDEDVAMAGAASSSAAAAVVAPGSSGSATFDETVATGAGAGAAARAAAGPDGVSVMGRLSPLDLLHNTLLWRHLAPTAPDTLPCYPFQESDPFVLDDGSLPHLLFTGNARAYGSRLVGDAAGAVRVRLVAVPPFWATGTAVLVNLRSPTLETQPVVFSLPLPGGSGGSSALPEFLV